MLTSRSRGPLPVPLLSALAGLAFSVWNAWGGGEGLCFSAGCTLYRTFAVNGVSLWWGGAAAFLVLAGLALAGRAALGRVVAGLGVALDCVLLGVMAMTLPCFACMGAGLLLALCYAAFRHAACAPRRNMGQSAPQRGVSALLAVWLVCFVMLAGVAAHTSMSPWAVRGPSGSDLEEGSVGATVRVFFSPSCGACRRLALEMPVREAEKAAWYPVAEDERDLAVILALKRRLAMGDEALGPALAASLEAPDLSFWEGLSPEMLLMRFRLWRNRARVIEAGEGRLPCVLFEGLPEALVRPRRDVSRRVPAGPAHSARFERSERPGGGDDATLPIDFGEAGSCGGPDAAPCPE